MQSHAHYIGGSWSKGGDTIGVVNPSDGEEFARAWIWAQRFGRDAAQARRCRPAPDLVHAFETMLVPRFYRGRLVGFVQQEDHRAVLRAFAKLARFEDDERKLSKLTQSNDARRFST